MKKLILVTSPPACGKTFISKQVAKALPNCVYLDKDTLIVLSKQIFVVAGEEYNRSSDFFQKNIRDYEYYCVLDLAFEALEYNDTVPRKACRKRCRALCNLGKYQKRCLSRKNDQACIRQRYMEVGALG